jgi:glutamate--cysteine ligase
VSLNEAALLEEVRQRLFSPTNSANPCAIGVELELIPVDTRTRRVIAAREGVRSSSSVLARLAAHKGWSEEAAQDDPSSWNLPDGARISFEPGGQIEISSSPHATASALIDGMTRVVGQIEEEMSATGISLVAAGVDPCNDIASVPLQLHRDRYTMMTDYLDSIGVAGVRMMRQTAALQINVERGSDPVARWRLLNALAPLVIALFANSRVYMGSDTGFASYRAHIWRMLDKSRTGLAYDASSPVEHYLRFALDAIAMRSGKDSTSAAYVSFGEWMRTTELGLDDWHFHLSTLFPEVRPRAYFELRSADTIDVRWLAAPIVFVTGLIYDSAAASNAIRLLGAPRSELVERAGRLGLKDSELRKLAAQCVELAVEGARALGPEYLAVEHVDSAREYFARALDAR